MPAISVIIPTRGRNHLLPRALRSLYNQTFSDFEIILVDDNPREQRVKLDPALASVLKHPSLRIVENDTPRNASVARNSGLKVAEGAWITYLDDDDAYVETKLEKQLDRAENTGLPLGLCGLAYNLAGRRRLKQVTKNFFAGSELLLTATADTKAIFHRNTGSVVFNENLAAGEDVYFFHCLVRHFKLDRVFNVPEALIEVYPQPGMRVNTNGRAACEASLTIYNDFGPFFPQDAARLYLARAEFQSCKFEKAQFMKMGECALRLLSAGGLNECRAIANGFLFKFPGTRRFVVS